ncbi:MAG: acetate--CoA ligase family protein [Thermodesulfobacteriota bacterium]
MLEALFYPQAVAVIGASKTPGKVGHEILANLKKGGFAGEVVPVNPNADTVLDLRCYGSLAQWGGRVDLALIVVPQAGVLDAADDAIRAGAKALIVISAGFKETGPEGAQLERRLAQRVADAGVRLMGPNCLGLINTDNRMNASFAGSMPEPGGISVISQSGALCTAILDLAASRHLGLAKLASIGNKANLTEVDFLTALAHDPQTKVIVGYLEDISDGDDFVKAAEEAANLKPVVLLKSGTTAAGLKAASSHTGVLAGSETAYGAAFKRAGVIRADTFEDLFDFATALSMQPLPKGDRTLIITNAGGPGTMAADAVEKAGMVVAEPERSISAALKEKLPRAASIGNPTDVLGDADPGRYVAALQAAQQDGTVDAVIVLLTPQAMTRPAETARAIAANLSPDKPVLAAFMGGKSVMPGRQELAAAGLPDYDSPERAVSALKAMRDYAAWRSRPPRIVTRFRVNRRRVERIIIRRQRTGRLHLGEVKSKDILAAYDFRVPEGYLTTSGQEAMAAAERIGFPVAMKIVSPDIVHKTDLGGVRLNLASKGEVRDAYDLMMLRMSQQAPNAFIEGVYVERMLEKGLEIILGMTRDPQFGPMLMFGLGGIFVEVMKDVTFHLAPITRDEAVQMLTSTRSYEILKGKRGQKGVDIEAIASGLQRISQLTTDFPQILELDINPYIVGEIGSVPIVADARMTIRPLEG